MIFQILSIPSHHCKPEIIKTDAPQDVKKSKQHTLLLLETADFI
jgi:hypothetical protein